MLKSNAPTHVKMEALSLLEQLLEKDIENVLNSQMRLFPCTVDSAIYAYTNSLRLTFYRDILSQIESVKDKVKKGEV